MEAETLVTFLFKAPSEVRIIELLGSWDNFTRPYSMFHDRRRGTGCWSGCFSFTDIIFDGITPDWSRPRNGGLQQGGMYWYYYRLDDGVEAFDDTLPATSECPLLPGQLMNVLHVPREMSTSPPRSRSASASLVGNLASLRSLQTLDPGCKYAVLDPPAVSKVHARCVSDIGLKSHMTERPVTAGRDTMPSLRPDNRRSESSAMEVTAGADESEMNERLASKFVSAVSDAPMHLRRSPPPLQVSGPHATKETQDCHQAMPLTVVSASDTDAHSIGPRSVQNVQFVSSSTSPRLKEEQQVLCVLNAEVVTSSNVVQERHRRGSSLEFSLSGKTAATPDVSSPCFSAATLSSNGGGLNTPFRLSGSCPLNLGQALNDKSLEDISARLRSFDIKTEDGIGPGRAALHDRTEVAIGTPGTTGRCTQTVYDYAWTENDPQLEASSSNVIFDELAYLAIAIH